MKSLDVLHLTVPINPAPTYNVDLEEPSLVNALKWHRHIFTRQMRHEGRTLKGYAWKNSRRAGWVQDLLTIDGNVWVGSLTDMQLTTSPRSQGSRLKSWLENYMCEQKQVRDARIQLEVNIYSGLAMSKKRSQFCSNSFDNCGERANGRRGWAFMVWRPLPVNWEFKFFFNQDQLA